MRLVFEDVSFSYETPGTVNRRGACRERARRRHARPEGSGHDVVWALQDVSFDVREGEFLGLAGHTGSGKSTLIQHMNGLLHPTRGRVCADGCDLADKKAAHKARGSVGVVFQYPERQLFAASVMEDVAFGPRNLGLDKNAAEASAYRALAAVGLSAELADRSPFELSGGQQRRVALAGVLAMEPKLLVLDEPAAGLDPEAKRSLLALVADLHGAGVGVVMASHNMDDLARLADRVLVLNEGRLRALGTPAEVFASPKTLQSVGLDAPFAQSLACDLRAAGLRLDRALYDIDALADDVAALYGKRGA